MLANIKLIPIILFASFLSLQGCGGGGGSDTPNPSNPPIGNTDGGTTDGGTTDGGTTDGSSDGGSSDGSTDGGVAADRSPAEILGNPQFQAIS